jgi:hypothetical protein
MRNNFFIKLFFFVYCDTQFNDPFELEFQVKKCYNMNHYTALKNTFSNLLFTNGRFRSDTNILYTSGGVM